LTYTNSINVKTNYSISSLVNEITYTFILLVFGWLVTKIPGIAGEIVSGMPNMSVSGVITMAVGAASIALAGGRVAGTAAKTAGQVAKAAGKGGK
jgi:type IV secretory pathway TrbL component